MLLTFLIILLVLSLVGGGWGHARFGYVGWSPAGTLLLLLCILWFTGNLR
jgi:hypothetical protein